MSKDKRHFTRISFNATALVTNPESGQQWMCELSDISLKGVLIARPDEWQSENTQNFTIKIQLAGEEIEINLDVTAVHTSENTVGFKVEHMDIDSATHLHRLIELNLGDESLLEREIAELIHSA